MIWDATVYVNTQLKRIALKSYGFYNFRINSQAVQLSLEYLSGVVENAISWIESKDRVDDALESYLFSVYLATEMEWHNKYSIYWGDTLEAVEISSTAWSNGIIQLEHEELALSTKEVEYLNERLENLLGADYGIRDVIEPIVLTEHGQRLFELKAKESLRQFRMTKPKKAKQTHKNKETEEKRKWMETQT